MDTDQVALFGSLNVELEPDPKFEARPEVRQSVLRCLTEQSPVGNDQWFGGVCTQGKKHQQQWDDSHHGSYPSPSNI
jgi:hypothetical protein